MSRLPAAQGGVRRAAPIGVAAVRRPWYRRFALRYAALVLVGLLVLGGGALYAVDRLRSEPAAAPAPRPTATPAAPPAGPLRPADVTVAVLNGTSVNGLARRLGDRVEGEGFGLGNVATSSQQDQAESVVLYVADRRRQARVVSERLGISQIERAGPDVTSLAGEADVVVVAGADQAPPGP